MEENEILSGFYVKDVSLYFAFLKKNGNLFERKLVSFEEQICCIDDVKLFEN
mgnify:CR=1 FL=1